MRSAFVAVVALLPLVVGGCTFPSTSGVDVDHETAAVAPSASSDAGPEPGVIREDWRVEELRTVDTDVLDDPEFHIVGGTLVTVTGWGITAYDAGTGEQTWHYREPDRTLAVGVTSDTVVVAAQDADDQDTGRLVGFDAGTGELLWEQDRRGRVGRERHLLTVADGIVPVVDPAPGSSAELVGVDARTGEVAWRTVVEYCGGISPDPPRTTDGSLLLLRDGNLGYRDDDCEDDLRWRAHDPATGELLWRHTWPGAADIHARRLAVADGTTLARQDSEVLVIDRDGTTTDLDVTIGSLAPLGHHVPTYQPPESAVVDAHTGEVVSAGWPTLLPNNTPTLTSDGTLYVLDRATAPVPGLIAGPVDGDDRAWMPMPGSELAYGVALWAGTVDGRLLLARKEGIEGPVRVFGYTTEPTEGPVPLGGVPPEDWPDPCDLPDVEGARDDPEPVAAEPLIVGGEEVPQRECRILFDDPDLKDATVPVTVRIVWVAPEPELAEDWLAGDPGPPGVDEVVGDGMTVPARIGRVLLVLEGQGEHRDRTFEALAEWLGDF